MKKWMLLVLMIAVVATMAIASGASPDESDAAALPTISIFSADPGDLPATENDLILQALMERLDIAIDRTSVSSDYEQQLNIRIAGGNIPDLFRATDRNQLVNFVERDVALHLDPYISEMPNVVAAYTEDDYQKGRVNGEIYGLAKRVGNRSSSFLLRRDWLDALGLEMPTTLDEFAAVAWAFTYDDPDDNGRDDTYGLTGYDGIRSFRPIFGAFGTTHDGNWMIRDGELVYSTTDPRFREAIEWIRDFIATGVVDPELMANKSQADMNKTFNGQIGINYRNLWEYYKPDYAQRIIDVNPHAVWEQVAALKGPYGSADREWDVATTDYRNVLSADLENEPEELDAVLRLIDYITVGEGARLVQFGIEGEHHTFDGTNVTVNSDRIGEVVYSHNYQLTGYGPDYLIMKYPWSAPYLEFVAAQPVISIYSGAIGLPEGVNFADKERYEQEEIAKFIYGIRPMEEWDEFVQTLYDKFDLQLYIDRTTADLTASEYLQ